MPHAKAAIQFSKPLHIFLCLLVTLTALDSVVAERLPVKTYTVADGLLRDDVRNIKQDSRGFLWFCTGEGISRFDGESFKNFTTVDGLPDRHVNDFLESKDGTIWIATDAGLARLNPSGIPNSSENPLFTVILADDPQARSVQVLFEDERGSIWAGTSHGLYEVREDSLRPFSLGIADTDPGALSIASIMKDRRGALWVGMHSGISRVTADGRLEHFTTANGLAGNDVSKIYEDKKGRIWVGLRAGRAAGVSILAPEPFNEKNIVDAHYDSKDGLPADWVTDFRETSDGKFWVATTGGLCEWREQGAPICKNYTTKNGLCDRDIWSITEDKDGNLWLGSRCGAEKWARYGFTSYAEADGTGYPLADSIFESFDGDLFASFNSGIERNLSRFDGEKFKLVKPRFPSTVRYFGWGWKQTILRDSSGDWWFPTGDGLFRFPRKTRFEELSRVAPQHIHVGARGNEIFRTFEDSHHDLWIATTGLANELWRWDRVADAWHNVSHETGVGTDRLVTAFVEDEAGNLWIGTGSDEHNTALIRYSNDSFTVFDQAENGMLAGWLRDLFIDHAGRLWIASTEMGLMRLDDVTVSKLSLIRYTPSQGLSSSGITCVTEDEFGRIYIGSGRGLDRLTPETGQIENFTTADGLPDSNIDVAYRDRNNILWFATAKGLARFVPEPQRQRASPNIFITGVRIGGEPFAISLLGERAISGLELDAGQRQVAVDFLGLGASLGEKLKYEYRLNGSAWTPTAERTVNFANLDSAGYQFEVRAITADRLYSDPATLAFQIAVPLWQRWWFISALVALTAFVIYVFYKYRLGRMLELERIRTRIATDLHDDIGSNLTRIALLSEVANQRANVSIAPDTDGSLSSIADIARESVASMNDIVWAISPEHDSLIDLTRRMRRHAEDVFTSRDIELDFQAPPADIDLKLSVGVRRDVLLIFKEAVSNAAKHSACTRVLIEFRSERENLKLRVEDNGTGFDASSESGGHGLASMTRRARSLDGKLLIDSNIGNGTVVTFEASLRGMDRQ